MPLAVLTIKALNDAYRHPEHQPWFQNIAGAILISSPHCISDRVSEWQNIQLIAKVFAKLKSKALTSDLAKVLAEDCQGFERAFQTRGIPVFTVYEEKETLISKVPWRKATVGLASCRFMETH